jgi:hypothetical protein
VTSVICRATSPGPLKILDICSQLLIDVEEGGACLWHYRCNIVLLGDGHDVANLCKSDTVGDKKGLLFYEIIFKSGSSPLRWSVEAEAGGVAYSRWRGGRQAAPGTGRAQGRREAGVFRQGFDGAGERVRLSSAVRSGS